MKLHSWNEIPQEQMSPTVTRQVIHSETMTVAKLSLLKGCLVPLHSHPNEQLSHIESGSLLFIVGGQEIIVKAGQVLQIPPHVPHSAEALEDTVATDMFSPPRQDWISGDDAYLRK
jgi:quercetin dioxygenase-like cupin family protein